MIAERVAAVRERLLRAATRAGRRPDEVTLVAISKTHSMERIEEAFRAGVRDFGENRVQEAEPKIQALAGLRREGARFHLVGHLQSNKARRAVELFDEIHSADDAALLRRLDRAAGESGRSPRILVQVDLAGEATKSGAEEARLLPLLEEARRLASLCVSGLMVLPPYFEDPEAARPFFRRLRELRDEARRRGLLAGGELSMGMSHDFEVAIEEGATLVRVGTAIFGERLPPPLAR